MRQYNTSFSQRESFTRVVTYRDDNGDPIPLTGYTAKMQLRSGGSSGSLAVELSTTNGRIVIDEAAGKVTLRLTPAETAVIRPGRYAYDLRLISSAGETVILEGQITVRAAVTR